MYFGRSIFLYLSPKSEVLDRHFLVNTEAATPYQKTHSIAFKFKWVSFASLQLHVTLSLVPYNYRDLDRYRDARDRYNELQVIISENAYHKLVIRLLQRRWDEAFGSAQGA
jgi:hypothetical protein